jgi:uncharacterized membrane protein
LIRGSVVAGSGQRFRSPGEAVFNYLAYMAEYMKCPGWFVRLRAIYKLLISIAAAIIVSLALLTFRMEGTTRLMITWDVFACCMIAMSTVTVLSLCPQQIRLVAGHEDESRAVVFVVVVIATLCSLGGVLLLLGNKGNWMLSKGVETFIYIVGVIFSWVLLHTLFTYRYAHYFYGDHANLKDQHAGGLIIPGEEHPDYLDFAYFSFVVGMTFQVSDIQITSRRMRRMALLHGLLSFVFNTVIVALTINVVVELKG